MLIVLGLIQGLCEFLPISSSGHLVLLSNLFGIEDSLFVSIILHVATLLSICVVFHKEIYALIRHPFSSESMSIYIATIPTCIFALIFMSLIDSSFEGGFLPFAFLISALVLFAGEKLAKKDKYPWRSDEKTIDSKKAFLIGISQGLAIFPGISRSGMTISTGLMLGGDKSEVAKFSFLLSMPVILLSLIMEISKMVLFDYTISVSAIGISLSFAIAFLVGIFSIKAMLSLTQRAKFRYFSVYLIIIAIISFFIL